MAASLVDLFSSPSQVFATLAAAYFLHSVFSYLTRPKNLPPFYYEWPYIPWLGSLAQFATGPREFLQRAALAKGDIFTIQLFGKSMTFLTGSEGHAHFFKQREHVFDIREAYAMTKITFGPGVCYDCPQSKMAQQFAFFKDGLSDKSFIQYMNLVQEEVSSFFEREWGDEGEADLLASLSDVFTLTSSRCLLGEEIRKKWNSSGMAEQYCKYRIVCRGPGPMPSLLFSLIRRHFINNYVQWHWIIRSFRFYSSSREFPTPIVRNVLPLVLCLPRCSKKSLMSALRNKKQKRTTSLLKIFCKY
jgi:hypothetical protein